MRLYQLQAILIALMLAVPFTMRALGTAGASSDLKSECRTTKDPMIARACRELDLK